MYKIKHTKKNILYKKKYINKSKRNKNKILNGGVFLGEGSFGCVVKPSLPCADNMKHASNKNKNELNKLLNKSVSKILIDPSESDKDEIIISNKLKNIDPTQKHFITFETACRLKHIPNERSNTVSVEYDNDTLESYDILDNKKYDKKHFPIDL